MNISLTGKHVLVLGLGLHGGAIGTIQWLAQQGATITVSDTKTKEQLKHSIEKLRDVSGITYHFGVQDDIDLAEIDMIVRNPGVPRTAPILLRARELNIPIEMDSGLFFEYTSSKNIIGITGSKGKTTASSAISAVMTALNPKTVTVGVDGVSPLGALPIESDTPIVFELSSWRLEPLQEKQISPHIAVVTSLYRDHLNTYASFEEYCDTKKQIIKNQTKEDIAILNADDELIRTWKKDVQGELYWFSLEKLQEDEQGIWVEGDEIFLRNGNGATAQLLCKTSDIPYTSSHELRNKLPAILIGILHGADISTITKALQEQSPLAHRLQFVKTVNGVNYINDSAATIPDALIAALQNFTSKPLIVILGGSDKALEFEELSGEIRKHDNISHLIWLSGTATDKMKQAILPYSNTSSYNSNSMEDAVRAASTFAHTGDVVLLSPGATSFGLFLHEFDRGNAFIHAVEQLK